MADQALYTERLVIQTRIAVNQNVLHNCLLVISYPHKVRSLFAQFVTHRETRAAAEYLHHLRGKTPFLVFDGVAYYPVPLCLFNGIEHLGCILVQQGNGAVCIRSVNLNHTLRMGPKIVTQHETCAVNLILDVEIHNVAMDFEQVSETAVRHVH